MTTRQTVKAADLQAGDEILLPRVTVQSIDHVDNQRVQITTTSGYAAGYTPEADVAILR